MTVRFPSHEEQAKGITQVEETRSEAKQSLDMHLCVYCGQGVWTSKKTGFTARLLNHYDARKGGDCLAHNHCARKH